MGHAPLCVVRVPINVAAATAFTAMIDFPRAPERIPAIKRIEMLTDGAPGVGTRFRETRTMFGRDATETMEVTQFAPGRGYELTAQSCGCVYRSAIAIEPRGEHACELRMDFFALPQTLVAKILSVIMRPMMKRCGQLMQNDMLAMKRSLEAAAKPGV